MDSDESYFNVSFIVRGKVIRTAYTNHVVRGRGGGGGAETGNGTDIVKAHRWAKAAHSQHGPYRAARAAFMG